MMAYSKFNTLQTNLIRPTLDFCNDQFEETTALLNQLYDLSSPAEFNYYLDKLTTFVNRFIEKKMVQRQKRNMDATAFSDLTILDGQPLGSQYIHHNTKNCPINSDDYIQRDVNKNNNLPINEQSIKCSKQKKGLSSIPVEDMDHMGNKLISQKSEEVMNKKGYSNVSVISNNTFYRCMNGDLYKNGLNNTAVNSKSQLSLSDIEEENVVERKQAISSKSVKNDNTHYMIRDWTLKKQNKTIFIVGTLFHMTNNQLIENNCAIEVHSRPDKSVIRFKGNYYHLDGKFICNSGVPTEISKHCSDGNFPRLWKSLFKSWTAMNSGKKTGEITPSGSKNKKADASCSTNLKTVDCKKKSVIKTPEVKISSAKKKKNDTPNAEVPIKGSEKSLKLKGLKTKKGGKVVTPTSSSKGKKSSMTKEKTPRTDKKKSLGERTGTPLTKKKSSMTKEKTPRPGKKRSLGESTGTPLTKKKSNVTKEKTTQPGKKRSLGENTGTPLTKKGKYVSDKKDKPTKKEKPNAKKLKDANKENKSSKEEVTMKECLRNEILASKQDLRDRRSPSEFFNNLDDDINDGVGGDNENKFISASDCLNSAKKASELSGRITPPNIGFECFLNTDGKNISATPHNHNKAINRKLNCVVKRMAAVQSKKGTKQPDPGKKLKNECASSKEVNRLLAAITTKSGSTPTVVKEAFRHEPNSSDLDSTSIDSDHSAV